MVFVDTEIETLAFLVLGALLVATLAVAVGALRSARRAEDLGEDRYELLREHNERLEFLREERQGMVEELERERRERLEAQGRVKELRREHPHLELEREIQRLKEEKELEREGRLHNHRERQRLTEELERERLARSEDQRETQWLQRELQVVEGRLEERQESGKDANSLWVRLRRNNR